MKVGDLVTPYSSAVYLKLPQVPMLVTGVFLDGKHVHVTYGSKTRIMLKDRLRVINESR